MQGENWVGAAVGAVIIWVNSLDYVFLGNITQLIALIYLIIGVIIKLGPGLIGKKLVSKEEYKKLKRDKKDEKDSD